MVGIRAKDLHFVLVEEEHTTVASALAIAVTIGGNHPLDVELAVTEGVLGPDVSSARLDLHYAVGADRPTVVVPGAHSASGTEEHGRVARGSSRCGSGASHSRLDHRRLRPLHVMNRPHLRTCRQYPLWITRRIHHCLMDLPNLGGLFGRISIGGKSQ